MLTRREPDHTSSPGRTVGRRNAIRANLLDALESDTAPRDEIRLGKFTRAGATTLRRANLELWRWIIAAGLAVLMVEWWYYHRRTV